MVGPISFTSLSSAGKMISTAIKLKDKGEILEVIIPLQEMINESQRQATEALTQIYTLTNENNKLKEKISSLEQQDKDRDKYILHTFPQGTHAWKLKESETGDYEFICPPCFEKGQKYGLQSSGTGLRCPSCKYLILTEHDKHIVTVRPRSRIRGF